MVVQGGVFHSYTDEARLLAAEAYIDKVTPIILFEPKLQNRLYNENLSDIEDICLENFNYLYKDDRDSGLISMDLSYKVKLKLPIQFYKDFPITETLVFRGFVGADEELDPMTFEEMESNEASHLVYVFPRAGGAILMKAVLFFTQNNEIILSSHLGEYDPCSLCKPGDLSNRNLIYCLIGWRSFHRDAVM